MIKFLKQLFLGPEQFKSIPEHIANTRVLQPNNNPVHKCLRCSESFLDDGKHPYYCSDLCYKNRGD